MTPKTEVFLLVSLLILTLAIAPSMEGLTLSALLQ